MGVRVNLYLGDTLEESSVEASGFELAAITREQAKAFGLPWNVVGKGYHNGIWGYLNATTGRVPNEFYVADPVDGSDVANVPSKGWTPFEDRGLTGVQIEKRAIRARLIRIDGKPDAVTSDEVECPPGAKTHQTGSTTLEKSVTVGHSVTSEQNWSITFGQKLEVNVEAKPEGIGAGMTRSFSLDIQRGGSRSKTHSRDETETVSKSVNFDVPPGRKRIYSMSVSRGSAIVDIDYEMHLIGICTAWYKKPLSGSSAFDFNVAELQSYLGGLVMRPVTERRGIGLVSDGKISSRISAESSGRITCLAIC